MARAYPKRQGSFTSTLEAYESYRRYSLRGVKFRACGVYFAMSTSVDQLKVVVREVWDGETAHRGRWSTDNPASGQCAVTALLVQDLLGGMLHRVEHGDDGHYFGKIAGTVIDLTADQFDKPIPYQDSVEVARTDLLGHPDTRRRYEFLLHRYRRVILAGERQNQRTQICYLCKEPKQLDHFIRKRNNTHYNMCRSCLSSILLKKSKAKKRLHHTETRRTCYLWRRFLPVDEFTSTGSQGF